jgi:hypothetical protein
LQGLSLFHVHCLVFCAVCFMFIHFRCICKIAEGSFYLALLCLSTWKISAPTEQILIVWNSSVFWKFVEKVQASLKSDKKYGCLCENIRAFMILSCWILIVRNVADESCRENKKKLILC